MKALTRADNPSEIIKWTQDVAVEINNLKKRIEDLEAANTALEARVAALEGA